ncbi:LysR substrate-binding domain-containing protein [Defluviimonas sp. WL0024]|uniref:LysR substrate-binding domain-containing protein n=2 Tax=Albidovulum TaxID=205889 RepID=A0ABT3J567_9RHOB|nr:MULTISPECIES: LysR substrate-binding domain-containing protein [Defluviimonas]MCU9849040.1 LysR substrate-binding domain-containing protein [Defluviimonas sp. WL0024]MCW3782833.1 LysR substrate-binding domain-containing protein [Defluviimonas salinarum]
MRYVQLRAFHYVAICGGFSRAAEELYLTQPAISDQVRKLEEEYDVLLFNRHKKQVVMTSAGERLLEITRRLFDQEQQALELLSESRALRSGTLQIVADSAHHLLHILGPFRERYPGVRINVRAGNTETVIQSLYNYESDIGVIGEIPRSRDFQHLQLISTPIVAFVATHHPLARVPSFSFDELARHPLVFREQGSRTRKKLEEAATAAGVALVPAIEAEGREAVREIVASGAGVGFVSAAEFGEDARLVRIPLIGAEAIGMDEALICLRERSGGKLVRAFFEIARGVALR